MQLTPAVLPLLSTPVFPPPHFLPTSFLLVSCHRAGHYMTDRYRLVLLNKKHPEAMNYCKDHYNGARLVMIADQREQLQLQTYLQSVGQC